MMDLETALARLRDAERERDEARAALATSERQRAIHGTARAEAAEARVAELERELATERTAHRVTGEHQQRAAKQLRDEREAWARKERERTLHVTKARFEKIEQWKVVQAQLAQLRAIRDAAEAYVAAECEARNAETLEDESVVDDLVCRELDAGRALRAALAAARGTT